MMSKSVDYQSFEAIAPEIASAVITPFVIPGKTDPDFPHKLGKDGRLFPPIGDLPFSKIPADAWITVNPRNVIY